MANQWLTNYKHHTGSKLLLLRIDCHSHEVGGTQSIAELVTPSMVQKHIHVEKNYG